MRRNYKKLYEELAERLVGIDATERFKHIELINYADELKTIEEKYYEVRPEQTVKNKLVSILDDIEEKLEEMQTEEYQLNTEDYDLNKDLFKLLRLIDMARKELKK